ncbi:hypothetical protein BALU111458_08670 [Bacillus luti]
MEISVLLDNYCEGCIDVPKGASQDRRIKIWSNRKIKKFILSSTNMAALINSEEKQIEFIHLVHDEYKKRR